MTMRLTVDDRLGRDTYRLAAESHIKVDTSLCETCLEKPCLLVCPAEVYELLEDNITYSYEGCLECGSCNIACHQRGNGAITWRNPEGGHGISYRYG